jgi:glycosyltransferase involved in cell wall biosynthesis
MTIPWPELVKTLLLNVRLVSVDRANWLFNHTYDWLARRWVNGCDIFHFVATAGFYSARKVEAQGGTVVCDVRTAYPDYHRRLIREECEHLGVPCRPTGLLYAKRARAEYELADYLFVPSEYARRTFTRAGTDPAKLRIVPYGVDLSRFSCVSGVDRGKLSQKVFRVLFVGRITPSKGVHYLIRAFEILDLPNAELLLIGSVDDAMQGLVADAIRRDPRIQVVGSLPHIELSRYYRSASVFVLPSVSDAFGLVVLEAMAAGVAVIVTENTGAVVREGIDGFTIPIRDVEALQERLLWFYEHPQSRLDMGQAASEHAQASTWERYGERLLEAYSDICAERGIDTAWS